MFPSFLPLTVYLGEFLNFIFLKILAIFVILARTRKCILYFVMMRSSHLETCTKIRSIIRTNIETKSIFSGQQTSQELTYIIEIH